MSNLLTETREALAAENKTPDDVRWIGVRDPAYLKTIRPTPTPVPHGTWADFERYADFNYDAGFGGNEVNGGLLVVGDDWWLERGEYDGSEWWEFKTLPCPPAERSPLRPNDLLER